jgi:hypothetical protein
MEYEQAITIAIFEKETAKEFVVLMPTKGEAESGGWNVKGAGCEARGARGRRRTGRLLR